MSGKRVFNRSQDRDREQRPRTVSSSWLERGQTTQDFAVGIGVFLLAIAFVFSFFPALVTPYDSSVGGAETAQADRIADQIVHNASTETPNELNSTEFNNMHGNLITRLGLRSSSAGNSVDNVNITVTVLGSDKTRLTAGEDYDDQAAASSARIVTIDDRPCEPACRLIVRVW